MRGLGLALLLVSLGAGVAHARRSETVHYPFSRVWTSAVRMVRVDFNSPITEKDKEDGYFLFEFEHDNAKHPGSVELVRISDKGVPEVQVVIQVPAMPSYVEQMLLDRLLKKLKKEYGTPPENKPAPPPDQKKPEQGGQGDAKKDDKAPKKDEKSSGSKRSS